MTQITIHTLTQTDTDTGTPVTTVWKTRAEAIARARHDAENNEAIDIEEGEDGDEWTLYSKDDAGTEHTSVVCAHRVAV